MLSKFFHCQWLDNKKHDWTEQVRCDLEDFGIQVDLETIENKSVFSWKQLVKRKDKELEFRRLLKLKESKNESKLKNLEYEKLEGQQYLTTMDIKKANLIQI